MNVWLIVVIASDLALAGIAVWWIKAAGYWRQRYKEEYNRRNKWERC